MQLFTSSPTSTATTSSNIITTATTTAAGVSTRPVPPSITSFLSPNQHTSIVDASTSTPVIADASNPSLLNQPSSQPLVKVSSFISLPHPNVVPDSESGGVGVGVGGGVAAGVVVVLVVVSVLVVGLYIVWRRRNTLKVELQPVIANKVFRSPVYESEWGLTNIPTPIYKISIVTIIHNIN